MKKMIFKRTNNLRNVETKAISRRKDGNDYGRKRKGFTIAELSLALGFVGVLLMTVAALTIFITGVYQKGLTIKAVNTSGEALVDDFTKSIQAAMNLNSRIVNEDETSATTGNAMNTFFRQWSTSGPITIRNSGGQTTNSSRAVPMHGHLCTGTNSYIWNTGYVLPENNGRFSLRSNGTNLNAQANQARVNGTVVHLLKVSDDSNRDVCGVTNGNYTNAVRDKSTTEMLPATSENPTVLYSLTLFSAATHGLTGHSYVSGTFILGTVRGSVDITTNSDICKEDPTEGLATDFNYCAINKFNFGIRATGKTSDT